MRYAARRTPHHPVAGLEAGHSRPDLDDLAGSIAASRPFGGCGFARLKAQVVERPELGPVRRRAVNLNRRKAVPPMEIGGITAFHAAGARGIPALASPHLPQGIPDGLSQGGRPPE